MNKINTIVRVGRPNGHPNGRPNGQRGMALVVSLMLLIVVALVGLAAVRGTIMQQRQASNSYDREQAFQAAEAGIRAAVALLPSNPSMIARNCQAGGVVCLGNPFTDPSLPSSAIHTVASSGSGPTVFTPDSVAAGQPQFVVEGMGNYTDVNGIGNNTSNMTNYGVQSSGSTSVYYRITSRSGDPARVGDRAVVTLQATIKQG